MLRLEQLSKRFGGLVAVSTVSFTVPAESIFALIGPNGAGKSTIFNLISGVLVPSSGDVVFDGRSLAGKKPHEIVRLGMARTFQKGRLFRNLTVEENVEAGLFLSQSYHLNPLADLLNPWGTRATRRRAREWRDQMLEFLGLTAWLKQPVGTLPYGQQRLVEIARALSTQPKLLLLDEPAAGMNPHESDRLGEVIQRLRGMGLTVVLIEHTMELVMGISDHVVVLNYGEIIAEGKPHEVQSDPSVLAAYLGSEYDHEVSV